MERRLFTSESVTEGHPDKMCDQVSDAILDALMEKDPMSRVACETAMTTGVIELKCPNCHRVVEVDLSLRKGTVKYRLTRSSNRANN